MQNVVFFMWRGYFTVIVLADGHIQNVPKLDISAEVYMCSFERSLVVFECNVHIAAL